MTWTRSFIPVSWDLEEIDRLEWIREDFNDPDQVKEWTAQYGPIFRTGYQADFRARSLDCNQTILLDLADQGVDLRHAGMSYYKMMPGDLLPYHADKYVRYRAWHGVEIHDIWRAIIFLQDWQPGFLFEIEGHPVTQYAAGEFVLWSGAAAHMAGNLGLVPRFTLQVTGMMDHGL